MEDQVPISAITPATMNWTCKIIVVDKLRPKTSRDQKVKFQTIIVQDENEEQICIILYGANIYKYRKRFKLFHTYLISTAKVRDPSIYAIRLNKFEWVVDAFTIVEAVPEDTENENELPPPTKLNLVSFLDFEERTPGVEIGDLLAVVANIGTVKYISDDKRRQDLIVIDKTRKPVFFTIWADLTDYEGKDLLQKVQEYQEHPVIVAKRISVSHYRGCRFATRFNSTISIDPPYPQAKELMNWAKENEQLLITYILKSSSDSPTELNLAPFEDEIVSTSTIPVASSEQTFFLEGEMSLTNDLQTFYVLVCSDCKHMVRHRQQKEVTCINCEQRKMLIPSCEFEVEITDGSGTVSAIISEKLAESILAMTAAEVYETTVVNRKLLPVQHITEQLANKTFKIHLQKSQSRSPDKELGTLVVLSYTRTHTMFDSPESSATMIIDERTKRNIECVTSVEGDHSSSAKRQKVEPTTPRKKQ